MFGLLFYPILSLLPVLLLTAVREIRRQRDDIRDLRVPVKEKLLRPVGESTRRKIEELDGQIMGWMGVVCAVAPALMVIYLYAQQPGGSARPVIWAPLVVVGLASYSWLTWRMDRLLEQRRNWRLGLSGELAVGAELNRLLAQDCHVFHDYPLAADWNIDHVVVAPTGVFAIETKTRRKGKAASKTQPAHEVIYDGHGLQFPRFYDKQMVAQAQSQANSLSKVLSITLDEPIPVTPILALPGWFIRRKTSSPNSVLVLNHVKEIRYAILDERRPGLGSEEIARITALIDAKCRDVEF